MKVSTKRLMLLGIYVGVCIVFWLPYLRCYLSHKPIGEPQEVGFLWNAILVPSVPLMLCFLHIPMYDIRALLGQPLYLALIFSPLLAVAIKPARWDQAGWRIAIGLYSIGFACLMLVSALFTAFVAMMGHP